MTRNRTPLAVVVCTATWLVAALAMSAQGQSLTPSEQLGKSIFFDQTLSINQNQSCASCHEPDSGWTGPNAAINAAGSVYEGSISSRFGNRKPPSAAYAVQSPVLYVDRSGLFVGGNFWDGRATGAMLGNPAADQALGPFLNPKEQALPDSACVVYRVCSSSYPVSFQEVWGIDACDIAWPADVEVACATEGALVDLSEEDRSRSADSYGLVGRSIATYEASPEVNPFSSKFDYSMRGQARLTREERVGYALFRGKAKCARCHIANGQQPLFTDYTFDNLGLPKNPQNPAHPAVDQGLGGFLETVGGWWGEKAAENMGKHKVPTMRNVDLRPSPGFVKAYGHNGYFKTLKGIVHFYNTRDVLPVCSGDYTEAEALAANCWPAPEVAENVNDEELGNLGLSDWEEAAIVAFLRTLSDGYISTSD